MSPRPLLKTLTAPTIDSSAALGSADPVAQQATESPTHLWSDAAALSGRLQHCLKQGETAALQWDDLMLLRSCLREADEELLPPDGHVTLQEFQRSLAEVTSMAQDQLTRLHVDGDRLKALGRLLQDVLSTQGRMERGQWHTYCGAAWEPEPEMLRKLGHWMCGGGVARRSARSEVGRQVLYQAAGFSNECHFGSDDELLELPRGAVLHDLMDSNTRAHVNLPGTAENVALLTDGLCALPLRTWRLHGLETLATIVTWRPSNLRTLDLTQLTNAQQSEAVALIRQAAADLPNLSVLKLPAGFPSGELGPAWETVASGDEQVLTRQDRPDGLALLDEAVHTWQGQIMATRLAIRRKASHPDGACLLKFAARLGQGPCSAQTGKQLAEMMHRASVSDHYLHAYAEQISQAREGEMAEDLMQAMHRRLGTQIRPTAVLLQAVNLPAPQRTPSELLSPTLTDEAVSEASGAYASGFDADVSELESPAAARIAHPLERWLRTSAASSGPRFEWPAGPDAQDSDSELSVADSLVSLTSQTSTLGGTVSSDSLVWAAALAPQASARAFSASASAGAAPSAGLAHAAGSAASAPPVESTAGARVAPSSRPARRPVQRPTVRPPLPPQPSRPPLQSRPPLPPRPALPPRPLVQQAAHQTAHQAARPTARSSDSGPT